MRFLICTIIAVLTMCSMNATLLADVVGNADKEIKEIVNPLLDNILEGFSEDSYAKYARDFDDTLKETISEPRFHEIDTQIQGWVGSYLYREYLGFLNKGKMTVIFWKGVFDKTQDDVLIKLVVSKRGNKYLITGLWFQ
ncbi:MAG: hypothetical protein GY853_10255 [PVC group bacterium]|nr:hypothetical protein [PVC group bacterium]